MIDKTKTTQSPFIQKQPGICGGNAYIRDTKIPIWTLVTFRQQGASNEELLRNYPELNQEDLEAAWTYYEQNKAEIDNNIEEIENYCLNRAMEEGKETLLLNRDEAIAFLDKSLTMLC